MSPLKGRTPLLGAITDSRFDLDIVALMAPKNACRPLKVELYFWVPLGTQNLSSDMVALMAPRNEIQSLSVGRRFWVPLRIQNLILDMVALMAPRNEFQASRVEL